MADDSASMVSTTTFLEPAEPKKRRKAASSSRPSLKEFRLLEDNHQLSRQLVSSLTAQVKTLSEENEQLREALRDSRLCNVVIFGTHDDLSVAAITTGAPEGVELFTRLDQKFREKKRALHENQIAFAIIEEVPVNEVHALPFRRV